MAGKKAVSQVAIPEALLGLGSPAYPVISQRISTASHQWKSWSVPPALRGSGDRSTVNRVARASHSSKEPNGRKMADEMAALRAVRPLQVIAREKGNWWESGCVVQGGRAHSKGAAVGADRAEAGRTRLRRGWIEEGRIGGG